MPRFSANISLLYNEIPLEDRFAAAAKYFSAVEIQFPYEWSAETIRDLAKSSNTEIVLFNMSAGNLKAGDIGIAGLPGREKEFQDAVHLAYSYQQIINAKCINILAGKPPIDIQRNTALEVLTENIRYALDVFKDDNATLVMEVVNTRDHPNFLLNKTEDALEIIDRIGSDKLKIQFDFYHRQIMQGDIINALKNYIFHIGHIQFADVPGRHEPSTGEINFPILFQFLDSLGYDGWVGAEYIPSGTTEESLSWLKEQDTD